MKFDLKRYRRRSLCLKESEYDWEFSLAAELLWAYHPWWNPFESYPGSISMRSQCAGHSMRRIKAMPQHS